MKFIKYLLPCLAGAAMFTSCDNLEEGDRLIDVEVSHSEKVVLIQEFSGQRCINCPTGASRIHDIIAANPGKVVAVAMYPIAMDNLTAPYGREIVRSNISTEYFNHYGRPNQLPAATFDGGAINVNIDSWSAAVMAQFSVEPPASIYLSGNYDKNSKSLKMDARVEFTENYGQDTSLILLLTESDIVGPQLMPEIMGGGINRTYTFNHVLRGSLNGTWGASIGSGIAGVSNNYSVTQVIDDNFTPERYTIVPENCSVVAILINTASRQILQAQEWSLAED